MTGELFLNLLKIKEDLYTIKYGRYELFLGLEEKLK